MFRCERRQPWKAAKESKEGRKEDGQGRKEEREVEREGKKE